jgi:hypothetical protein
MEAFERPTMESGTDPAQNRTTAMTWTADNQLKTLKAKNNETGDQTTTWLYGTTLSDSDVARNGLVRAKEFPDKATDGAGQSQQQDPLFGVLRDAIRAGQRPGWIGSGKLSTTGWTNKRSVRVSGCRKV